MSRRSGQNGYIEKKGGAYVVRFWMDVPEQEKRVHKSVRICPVSGNGKMSKPERERRAKQIIAESGADTEQHFRTVQQVNLGTTFQQQADWWVEHIQTRKRNPVKPHTAGTWRSHLKWINQRIGGMPLASVNNSTAKMLVAEMAQNGSSPKTIFNYLQVIKQVIASAVDENGEQKHSRKWNHEFIDLPVVENQNTPMFTTEQVSQIVSRASGQYRVLYALLAGTGMRIGEALGLEVGSVSADGQTITVKQSAWEGRIQSPKTRNAYRQIDIHPSLASLLLEHIGGRTSGFLLPSRKRLKV
jgi:integrase